MAEMLCEVCGHTVDYDNGGAALMLTLCYNHGVTMSNVSYCGKCFGEMIRKPLAELSDKARLNIPDLVDADAG